MKIIKNCREQFLTPRSGDRGRYAVKKSALRCAVAAAMGLAATAHGQLSLEEVVVTARKQMEVAQDVPIAITALSSAQLDRAAIGNFEEATALTPGFKVNASSFSPLAPNLSLRGSVQNSVNITDDASVGIYSDGVYIARPFGLGVDLVDLADVQVLKGPQGTLFGRNTTAGALLLNSNSPELGQFSGSISGTGGQDLKKVEAVVNVPLGDMFALRVAHLDARRDDYVTNLAQDPDNPLYTQYNNPAATPPQLYTAQKRTTTKIGGYESELTRVKLRFAPTDDFDAVLSHEEYWKDLAGPARETVWLGNGPMPFSRSDDVVSLDFDPRSWTRTRTDILTLTYETDALGELKFIASQREYKTLNESDYDGGALANKNVGRRHGSWGRAGGEQETYELQWTNSFLDERVDFTSGLTYFKEEGSYYDYSYGQDLRSEVNRAAILAAAGTAASPAGGNGAQIDDNAKGIYAQATWHINDVSNLTVGLRYSEDEKSAIVYGTSGQVAIGQLPTWDFDAYFANPTGYYNRTIGQPLSIIDDTERFSSTDWMVSYDYKLTDDIMAYAKVSTGYRAGGFNSRGSNDPNAVPFTFKPEELLEYELGLKADFLDGRLRWNTAIYSNETTDKQFTVVIPNPNPNVPPGTANKNAGQAESRGLETELTWLLHDNWSIAASYAYIDAKITEIEDPATGEKVDKRFIPDQFMVPKHEYTFSLNYDQEFGNFKLSGTAMWHWVDEMSFATSSPDQFHKELELDPAADNIASTVPLGYSLDYYRAMAKSVSTDAHGMLNLNLTVSPLDERFSITLWGKNVLDERAKNFAITNFGTAYQYVSATYTEPRTYGVTVKANF
jgi:iron complex outermembrane receptor protein